jgi:prepilin-type N-terminal cleavage/methylation domain-containing protein
VSLKYLDDPGFDEAKTGLKAMIQCGYTLTELLFTVAILAIVAAIALPNIVAYLNQSEAGSLSREAYAVMQDWSKAAILQGGATLYNQGTAMVISGAQGYQKSFSIPSGVTVNLDWNDFPTNACQYLNGDGIPSASANCPSTIGHNAVPLLSFCKSGVCHGAHS